MKATKILLAVVAIASLILAMAAEGLAQTTLYTDSFSGAGTALNGTLVEGGTLQTGSVAWSANSAFFNNGTIDEAAEGSAILPFAPVVDMQYTLSMDALNASANWIALGFKNSALGSAGASQVNDRFSNGGGLAWMLYRNNPGNNNSIELFGGPNTGASIADINNQAGIDFNSSNNLKIVINTSGAGNSFTADFFVNNSSISNGPQLVSQPLSTIQFVGLSYDNTAGTQVTFDNFLLTQTPVVSTVNEWNVDGGGTFGTAGNWTMGTPAAGSTVLFGDVLTAPNSPATVTLAAPASLAEVQFSNAVATYNLAGPSTLTLTGGATVNTIAGNHEISANIAGSAGLTKTGTGQLTLSSPNSVYSGTTNVQAGSLRIRHIGAVPGTVNVDSGASVFFEGNGQGTGFNGAFTPNITGAGEVGLSAQLTTETVTFNNAKSYTGITTVNGGTLSLAGSGTLGTSDGTAASRTQVGGNENTGKLAISGGIAVANELLQLGARELSAIDSVHLTSSGTNSWTGNIKGEVGGTQYNIESTAGTLTLSGTISAPDTATRNFVFSGAGNTNITGKIVDVASDANGVAGTTNALNNVSVTKRGSGKLTISTATGVANDYWFGGTTVEAGTLEVLADGPANNGELRSSTIAVRAGAVLDIDSFSNYSVQSAQDLSGGGDIHAQTLSVFGDSLVSPGDDGVGTMTLHGAGGAGNANLYIGSDFFDAAGARGGLAFDLAGATTVGGGVNDHITGVNNLTLDVEQYTDTFTPLNTDSPIEVLVTPVQNQLAGGGAGTYRLISYTGTLTNVANTSVTFAPQLEGVGVTRQTLAVSTATGGQVNLVVSGAAANLTWNGSAGNNTWDVDVSTNWTGADGKFKDLDNVTFGTGGVKDVVLNSSVHPGTVNFSGGAASTYTITGTGGISGGATVNVNSGTVRLRNRSNAYSGTTTIASGARLEMSTSNTGAMVVNGVLAVPSTLTITTIDQFDDTSLSEYTFTKVLDQGTVTNTSFSSPAGVIASTSTGADGAEQVMFMRNDGVNLDVGEELRVDNALSQANGNDLGIVVGATPTAGSRDNYIFMSFRATTQLNTRGFSNGVEFPQEQAFGVNADQLFIARTATDTFEVGWYDGTTRNILTTRAGVNSTIGNNVGFYSDLRADGAGYNGLDNLVITTGTPNNTVSIDGNLTLAGTGTLELDVSAFDFTALDVSGTASLAGTLSVNLLNGFMPEEGASYAFLTADGGITNAGLTFDLPTLTGGLSWNTSDFFATGVLSVVSAGTPGDFDNDGDVDGRDFLMWQRGQSPDPLSAGDLAAWQANYGATGPLVASSVTVPEPMGCVLIMVMSLAMGGSRLRQRLLC